ncbi:Thoeris anti-defense Tad2 family protein [Bacillus cereus group sp. MYBK234-1]|uniref:Thoeris anti-defense Tad2 family protein n=1 Tax=unclassified Bacillus cereus group TaxID=2750818 RepID=UPI003F797653
MNMYSKVIKGNLSFGDALNELRAGKKVKRSIWGGYWRILNPFVQGEDWIIAFLKDNKGYAPAQPYQADMLANDWMVVE